MLFFEKYFSLEVRRAFLLACLLHLLILNLFIIDFPMIRLSNQSGFFYFGNRNYVMSEPSEMVLTFEKFKINNIDSLGVPVIEPEARTYLNKPASYLSGKKSKENKKTIFPLVESDPESLKANPQYFIEDAGYQPLRLPGDDTN